VSLALYRKYRPGSFAEVKGQEHVTVPLQQALRNGRVHHAYLFSGPRGCGKTSSARILARSLNCEQGPTPDPCGTCDSCVALAPNGPGSLDVVEIDAASHGGVDDARDLRERAFYAPVSSPFKIYIIDEAHMVSREGFNALLKLVEEPPEFLRFVFATTEPEKVLATIRSRTHHYPFRLMPRKDLTQLLTEVVESEGIQVDPTVLPLVVRAAAGSARDGLSILDQVLASAGADGVTRESAASLLGVTPDTLLADTIDAIAAHDAAAVFAAVDRVMENGHDPRRFAADVLERLRDLIVLDAVPEAGEKGLLDCPPEQLLEMARQASSLGTAGLSRAADIFHAGLVEMRGTTSHRLLLELMCARVLLPAASSEEAAVLTRLERLERRFDIAGEPPAAPSPAPATAPAPAAPVPAVATQPEQRAEPSWPAAAVPGGSAPEPTNPRPDAQPVAPGGLDTTAVRRAWDAVMEDVKNRKRTTWVALSDAQVQDVDGSTLTLAFSRPGFQKNFSGGANAEHLNDALQVVLGRTFQIASVIVGEQAVAESAEPVYEGLAPGDEITPEDPELPPPARAVGGEDEALKLLSSELGGTVMGSSES
jgi:DNA polymerase-3 subunit gamma/tau